MFASVSQQLEPPDTVCAWPSIRRLVKSCARRGCHWSSGLTFAGLVWFAAISSNQGQTVYQPGQAYFGRSNYIEYLAGDMPVIFSVPHGGSLTPAEIPNRNCVGYSADCATISDGETEELARAIQQAFRSHYSHSPHVIICRLKRTKLDANRDVREGAAGSAYAQQAWEEFHRYINIASNAVVASTGRGLYIDLHGQSHPVGRVELGYLLTADQLTNSDATLNQPAFAAQSSFRTLAAQVPIPFSQLLRGSNSFGALLLAQGYPAVPNPVMPNTCTGTNSTLSPADRDLYFGGGYNTRLCSSVSRGGPIDGLQVEVNYAGVRDSDTNRTKFAAALAQAMEVFFASHYRIDLRTGTTLADGTAKPAGLRSDPGLLPPQRPPAEKSL
jgi:hypothetical protein